MFEDFKKEPIKVTPSSEIGLTTKQRERLQRVTGMIDAFCYIAQNDMADALTSAVKVIDDLLAEDMDRKRGLPCE